MEIAFAQVQAKNFQSFLQPGRKRFGQPAQLLANQGRRLRRVEKNLLDLGLKLTAGDGEAAGQSNLNGETEEVVYRLEAEAFRADFKPLDGDAGGPCGFSQ